MSDVVKKHFDEYAARGDWQSYYSKRSNRFSVPFQLRYEKFAEYLGRVSPTSVLDAGCGSGDFVLAMPKTVKRYRGIDLSEQMVLSARECFAPHYKQPHSCDINFSVEDILTYSPNEQFDFVLASGLTEYFDDIESVFSKIYELTNSKGFAAVQTPNRNFYRWKGKHKIHSHEKGFAHHRLSYNELDTLAEKVGFRKVQGSFVNHLLIPFAHRIPTLHRALDLVIGQRLPDDLAETRASMYIGLYQKLE